MNMKLFSDGVWPVMLTPYTKDNQVDYPALGRLVDWYIHSGVAGLFAVCQSSEMFFLTLEERVEIARFVKKRAGISVKVVASGHISDSMDEQLEELTAMSRTGIDALILIPNRLARADESDTVLLDRLKHLYTHLPADMPLGFYECPYPYKRLVSPEILKWCADTGRFYFIKDTSCDIQIIEQKLAAIQGTQMRLYNANTTTLLESLRMGASGYSGVMANFHPEIYTWLCTNFAKNPEKAARVQGFLNLTALIERQVYPLNAKYYQKSIGNFHTVISRTQSQSYLTTVAVSEIDQYIHTTMEYKDLLGIIS